MNFFQISQIDIARAEPIMWNFLSMKLKISNFLTKFFSVGKQLARKSRYSFFLTRFEV